MKHLGKRFLILGYAESFYTFKNEVTLIKANLILDLSVFELRLNFTKYHIGGDEGETKTHLTSYNVGTFFKPKKRLINSLLKDHQLRNRPFERWHTDYSKGCTVTELFKDIKEKDIFIIRAIKLMKITKVLKKKKKL